MQITNIQHPAGDGQDHTLDGRWHAIKSKNSTEPARKHVFWGLTKNNTEKHFYHLGYRG